MSTDQIHPEGLLDRAREGALTAVEAQLLRTHLAVCSACRLQQDVAPALYHHMPYGGADDVLLDRLITAQMRRRAVPAPGARRKAAGVAAIALAILSGAAISWAGGYLWRAHSDAETQPLPPAPPASRPAMVPRGTPPMGNEAVSAPAPLAVPPPASAPAPTSAPPLKRSIARARAGATTAGATTMDDHLCADLYRRANEERRAGRDEEALHLYQTLHRSCAGGSEDQSARVLLGRLYLDRLSDPARALAAFDAYLESSPHGTLGEDAMIGRALSLGRLRNDDRERQAWQALIAAYPDSLYLERARARLNQLRAADRR
ncbi:MAG TPA: tetratricopeptide repeat protein [Polyangia bacterium]|nr:tetratricopeptide repeat protein [Polyangia bacterium]